MLKLRIVLRHKIHNQLYDIYILVHKRTPKVLNAMVG